MCLEAAKSELRVDEIVHVGCKDSAAREMVNSFRNLFVLLRNIYIPSALRNVLVSNILDDTSKSAKVIMFSGPPGCGKSEIAHVISLFYKERRVMFADEFADFNGLEERLNLIVRRDNALRTIFFSERWRVARASC